MAVITRTQFVNFRSKLRTTIWDVNKRLANFSASHRIVQKSEATARLNQLKSLSSQLVKFAPLTREGTIKRGIKSVRVPTKIVRQIQHPITYTQQLAARPTQKRSNILSSLSRVVKQKAPNVSTVRRLLGQLKNTPKPFKYAVTNKVSQGFIYKITDKTNNKIYIGQTVKKSPIARLNEHFADGGRTRTTDKFDRLIRAKGKNNFTVTTLAKAKTRTALDNLEAKFISKFKATNPNVGYNVATGTSQSFKRIKQFVKFRKGVLKAQGGGKAIRVAKLLVTKTTPTLKTSSAKSGSIAKTKVTKTTRKR